MTTSTPAQATYRTLSAIADRADARFTETVKSRTGKTRWTMTASDAQIPEIAEAFHAKKVADAALLTFLRTTPNSAHSPE